MSAETSKYVFGGCAFWSVLCHLKWHLIIDPSSELSTNQIKEAPIKKKDFAFYYQHKDKSTPFILIAMKIDADLGWIHNFFGKNAISDWLVILEKLAAIKFEDFDFNQSVLVWNVVYQQCAGTFIDCMNGGAVNGLPDSWFAFAPENYNREDEEALKMIDKNCNLFLEWRNTNIKINNEGGYSILFYIEFVKFFEEKFKK